LDIYKCPFSTLANTFGKKKSQYSANSLSIFFDILFVKKILKYLFY